jgi:hypothetical protein
MLKIEIVKFEAEHANSIIERNKNDGLIVPSKIVNIEDLVKLWRDGGPSYTMLVDNIPIVCAGVVLMGWNRGEAWTFPSKMFYDHVKSCYKGIKNILESIAREHKLIRIQSMINPSLLVGDGWMKHLGFQYEGTLRCFGCNNEDMKMFSRIFPIVGLESAHE